MRASLLSSILLSTLACAHASPRPPVAVTRFDATVVYFGVLSKEGLAALKAADNGSASTLLIRSDGGEVGIGMDFGEWVHSRNLDVVVDQGCYSSCANYVFPAARNKLVLPGSVVAWHGDAHLPIDEDIAKLPAEQQAEAGVYIAAMRAKETAFFERIGVSECVTRLGRRLGVRGLYALSAEDMQRFGIHNVGGAPRGAQDIPERMRNEVTYARVPAGLDARTLCE